MDKSFKPEVNVLWSNLLYRAFHLFAEFNGDAGTHQSTTGYIATPTAPFTLRIDKPAPDPKTGEWNGTMTTGREGPYEVDLRSGTCQCRFSAGHPWVLYESLPNGRKDGKNYVCSGTEAKAIQNWRVLKDWFPELPWGEGNSWGNVFVDMGSDPAADCKHLCASYLVLLACIADREGISEFLPEATERVVGRLVDVAFRFKLFPELK